MPIRLIAILPMLLLAAALLATACESAAQIPNESAQQNNFAAAAPTTTSTPTTSPTPQHTQTPTATPTATAQASQCQAGYWYYLELTAEIRACAEMFNPLQCPADRIPPPPIWDSDHVTIFACLPPPTPTPQYEKLQDGLSYIAEAQETDDAATGISGAAGSNQQEIIYVVVEIDRDPKELVKWLASQGVVEIAAHYTSFADDEWLAREGGDIDDHYGIIFLRDYLSDKAELEPPYEGGITIVDARVPTSLLLKLSQQPGVIAVRKPRLLNIPIEEEDTRLQQMPQSQRAPRAPEPPKRITPTPTPQYTSWGVAGHGVTSWHQAGYKGKGVKIGIIDTGFIGFSVWQGSDLPTSVSARCYDGVSPIAKTKLSDCADISKHGVYVSEVVYDIAPDATYYIAQVRSRMDLILAVNWMVSQGVDVINQSLVWRWDGTGDGKTTVADSPLKVVDRAVSKGVTWINAAGNDARQT